MKRNCLCVFLALLLCLSLTVPTFAESDPEPPDRVTVPYSFGLKHVSGSTYKMKATCIVRPMKRTAANHT